MLGPFCSSSFTRCLELTLIPSLALLACQIALITRAWDAPSPPQSKLPTHLPAPSAPTPQIATETTTETTTTRHLDASLAGAGGKRGARRRRRKHQELVEEVTTIRTVTRSHIVPRPTAAEAIAE
jgi:hypothetical protein